MAGPRRLVGAREPPGKVLEELRYQVDVWVWKDAVQAKVDFREAGAGRYRADLDRRSQGLLAVLTGGWEGGLSTEMEYCHGKLQPLVYRDISTKNGKKRVMEYRFHYAGKKGGAFQAGRPGKNDQALGNEPQRAHVRPPDLLLQPQAHRGRG